MQAMPDFVSLYKCDPFLPHWGFNSWDDFFTREFRTGVRPVEKPKDDSIIVSACESTVYQIATNVKALDQFWIKGEPYSLNTMLNYDEYTSQFVGGTVYQAFPSATKYHRWHSPVNGEVVKVVQVPGTYYAASPAHGFPNPDPGAPNLSQAFITSLAARALIFIQADNPDIGLFCFMAVGMAEVSSCEVTVEAGNALKKGDQTGMFHFGGSTYCLIFRPGVHLNFTVGENEDVNLNISIATVSSS